MKTTSLLLVPLLALALAGCQPKPTVQESLQLPTGDPQRGKEVFVTMQCSVCHGVAGWKGEALPRPTIKPAIPVILGSEINRPTAMQRLNSILSPSHKIAGTPWPERATSGTLSRMGDYNDVLTVRQLADLVAFLDSLKP